MKWTSARITLVGAGLASMLLIANAVVSHQLTQRLIEDGNRVSNSRQVALEILATLSALQDAETGQRGYLITEATAYLKPYSNAHSRVLKSLDRLTQLTAADPAQQRRVNQLRIQTTAQFDELSLVVLLTRTRGFEEARRAMRSDRGKEVMDASRTLLADMKVAEELRQRMLEERVRRSGRAALWIPLLVSATAVAVFVLTLFAARLASPSRTRV